jgi:hypothetical protein
MLGWSCTMSNSGEVLRRYTSLPALLHFLRNRKLTLLSPEKWEDRNDAYYMRQYRERSAATTVLALCFSKATEKYHFWRVFTHGTDGVCIEFERETLLASFDRVEGVELRSVNYKMIKSLSKLRPKVRDLPFLKRAPYSDEREFRIVYVDHDEECESKDFAINLSCIRRVTINPWMPKPLLESVRATIRSIKGCRELRVSHTTLLENEQWKRAALSSKPLSDKVSH